MAIAVPVEPPAGVGDTEAEADGDSEALHTPGARSHDDAEALAVPVE